MHYEFKNVNPLNEIELDCVCRAITGALDLNYYDVMNKLNLIGALFECPKLCVCCYKFLLDNVFNLERIEEVRGLTIREFLGFNPHGTYLIRLDGHLTYCTDGICYDTFDCTNEEIILVWKVY